MTMPEMRLDGRVCIITGAGLGRARALELARRGTKVLVNDLRGALDGSGASKSAAQLVVDEITSLGGRAAPDHESVATPAGGEAIVQAALSAFGRVDVLGSATPRGPATRPSRSTSTTTPRSEPRATRQPPAPPESSPRPRPQAPRLDRPRPA